MRMPAESGPLRKASMDSVRCDFVMDMSFAMSESKAETTGLRLLTGRKWNG